MSPIARIARILAVPIFLAAFAIAVEGPGDPPPAEGGYIGAQSCKVCHNTAEKERRWDTWMNTKHADALETLKSAASAEIAKAKGLSKPAWEAPECLKCHVTAYDTAKAAAPARIDFADAVQCETCHGPGAQHVRDAQLGWVEKKEAIDISAHIDYPDKSNCLQCHNTDSPTWDPARYTLPDGTTSGFDYNQAKKRSIHPETDARPLSKPTTMR
jgi:YD repeat-containing protein